MAHPPPHPIPSSPSKAADCPVNTGRWQYVPPRKPALHLGVLLLDTAFQLLPDGGAVIRGASSISAHRGLEGGRGGESPQSYHSYHSLTRLSGHVPQSATYPSIQTMTKRSEDTHPVTVGWTLHLSSCYCVPETMAAPSMDYMSTMGGARGVTPSVEQRRGDERLAGGEAQHRGSGARRRSCVQNIRGKTAASACGGAPRLRDGRLCRGTPVHSFGKARRGPAFITWPPAPRRAAWRHLWCGQLPLAALPTKSHLRTRWALFSAL
ncbi:hypothetical protein GN956_G25111 [Arapaima gigas]